MANQFQKQLNKLRKQEYFMIALIVTFVMIIVWTFTSIFVSQQKISVSQELRDLSKPLNPNLNQEVLLSLEKKKFYSEKELSNFPIYQVVRLDNDKEEVRKIELTSTGINLLEIVKSASESAK
jgi:hypothetical protein